MPHDGITDKVRNAAKTLGEFNTLTVDHVVHKTYGPQDYQRIKRTIKDLVSRGEVINIAPDSIQGHYRYVGRGKSKKARLKIDIIWHLVRSHRRFATDDIERLSGAKRRTIQEFLQFLTRDGILRRVSTGQYLLIKDPGPETPVDYKKRAKLKRIREQKK